MDTLAHYRSAIRQVLDRHTHPFAVGEIDVSQVIDETRDHYQVFMAGWANRRYHYGPIISFRIKNGKVWIDHNGTEADIPQELMDAGVPREDIVLGWHSPSMRKRTDFAVG